MLNYINLISYPHTKQKLINGDLSAGILVKVFKQLPVSLLLQLQPSLTESLPELLVEVLTESEKAKAQIPKYQK